MTLAGIAGQYPSATYRLNGAGATSDLASGTFNSQVKSATAFEYWDSAGVRQPGAGSANIIAANIVNGVSVFGTAGSVTVESHSACASDGASGCAVDGTLYKAARLANFVAADVKSGITIASVGGSSSLETHSNCAADAGVGCVATASYPAANASIAVAGNIKSGVTIAGASGQFPSATYPLSGGGITADLTSGTFDAQMSSATAFEYWDSTGARQTGAGDADIVSANIGNGWNIFGTTGSAILETHSSCTSDAQVGCLPNGTTYKAARLANFVAGDVRSTVTIAGVLGAYPSAAYRLAGANGTDDLDTSTFDTKMMSLLSFEWFDSSGVRYTNSGAGQLKNSYILAGVSIFGVSGTYSATTLNVSNLSVVKGTGKVTASWSAMGTGVIIVRRETTPVSWRPVQGNSYSVGSVDVNHTIVYKGAASTFDDTSVTSGTTYYYQAYAYNADNAYSAGSAMASLLYSTSPICGGAGDSCYDNATAIAAQLAMTPSGKNLEYYISSGSFRVWKEVGASRILNADGFDNWAITLNLNGKGFSGTEFMGYGNIAGRVCPTNVYIDDSTKFATGKCLYYSQEASSQALNAAGTSQTTYGSIGMGTWSSAKWYVGNIQTCASKGMRLPTLYETTTVESGQNLPTGDGTPTFATTTGVPSITNTFTWSATALPTSTQGYWTWKGTGTSWETFGSSFGVRCVLP